jgi:signal transduction histidine kinase
MVSQYILFNRIRKLKRYFQYITEGGSFYLKINSGKELKTFTKKFNIKKYGQDSVDTGTVFKTALIIPFSLGKERIGTIGLYCDKNINCTKKEIEFIEDFVHTIGIAVLNQSKQAALLERVKELTCLYGMSRISELSGITREEIIYRILELLPPAWQYPEVCHARIVLDGYEYTTPYITAETDKLTSEIVINGTKRGYIEIIYSEKLHESDEGPFLKEERSLIETISKQLAFLIERIETEEDKKKLQEQLRHADRLATVGELSAGVAHELNEPLATILGFAQLIEKTANLPKRAKADIDKIIKSSLHAREIVKKLMFFSRQMPPNKTSININHVVTDGLYFLESRCTKEGIKLVRHLGKNLPDIIADAIQLNQVIVNIVVNAIQAMPGGGKLEIRTSHSDNYVSLYIRDTGTGMSKDIVRHVFEPFFSTKEIGKGTGLGLSVVHGIVTSHGGKINIESEPGKGTSFEVLLPVVETKQKN